MEGKIRNTKNIFQNTCTILKDKNKFLDYIRVQLNFMGCRMQNPSRVAAKPLKSLQ